MAKIPPKMTRLEETLQQDSKIIDSHKTESNIDLTKPKFFCTFPFPYSNGLMHLGHAYTVSKADFMTRYHKLIGDNTMFPFGFHGTGMPIVSCAKKLELELKQYHENDYDNLSNDTQIKILLNMHVSKTDLHKFTDPYFWITYFPQEAIKDINSFGIDIDWRRSFVTTDMNKYFDSFVKWQFKVMSDRKYLVFGNKYIIYSIQDGQPCADHDRSVGEGIEPKEYLINTSIEINDKTYGKVFILCTMCTNNKNKHKIYYNKTSQYTYFKYQDKIYVTSAESLKNIMHQIKIEVLNTVFDCSILENNTTKCTKATGFYISEEEFKEPLSRSDVKDHKSDFTYYEPEKQVISRSGDKCIVALTNQWFINYGDPVLKERVLKYVDTQFDAFDSKTLKKLRDTCEWLDMWPCSRSYGLGTKLLDTNYVIDSLSDSTIYMAYYCVSHLVTKLDISKVTYDMWNAVFFNHEIPKDMTEQEKELVSKMQQEFKYWYPFDLRVSGKDLLGNHLAMAIFAHFMIWSDEKMAPKAYMINGHLMLDGDKMSKSTGNFMTLRDAINKYGSDAVRYTLANFESLQDADFYNQQANGNFNNLYNEKLWIKECIDTMKSLDFKTHVNYKDNDFWENYLELEIIAGITAAKTAYTQGRFPVIIKTFNQLLNARNKYKMIYTDTGSIERSPNLMYRFIEVIMSIIQPICPVWVQNILNYAEQSGIKFKLNITDVKYDDTTMSMSMYRYFSDLIMEVQSQCNVLVVKKKKHNIKIDIVNGYTDTEKHLINLVSEYLNSNKEWKVFMTEFMKGANKKTAGVHAKFMGQVKYNFETYGKDWNKFITMNDYEYNLISKWIPILLNFVKDKDTIIDIKINKIDASNVTEFKYSPGNPNVSS
jgi:leucyl-tRNA synthetase